ncbi:hypothetical protein [Actinomadura rubrisoli]|uniref:Uncharacterized protein n=1 Tax=Actinomadura rubrisoli TaxID=2530368 RepID=A0A4R5BA30_9ACTN|nr:hypothetical protein [Actinomadura rubrisoli]TDD81456.1 hypothetical protein E1298_24120 [Actinomadura rubrisoli]
MAVPFLLARRYAVGERFILGPDEDDEDLRRAVSKSGGREFPADPRYRVVPYGPGLHAIYREFELTAADLGVQGPVRDEHGRSILAIEGLAVTGDPSSVDAADLAAAHERALSRYADLWRADRKPEPRRVPRPPRPSKPARSDDPARPVWIWVVLLVLGLIAVALLLIMLG